MGKSIIAAFLAGFICLAVNAAGRWEKGNGNIITSERTVSQFDRIENRTEAVVRFHAAGECRVVVSVDSNLDEYVEISVADRALKIGTRFDFIGSHRFTQFIVDVYAPLITGISLSGSGRFECVDKIVAPEVLISVSGSGKLSGSMECDKAAVNFSGSGMMEGSIKCVTASIGISGSGSIDVNMECEVLAIRVSGSGKITLAGSSKNSEIRISGSGDILATQFRIDNANVNISGSGNLNIWAVDYLDANVSGSGRIIYRGNPRINFSGSGSGRIRSE